MKKLLVFFRRPSAVRCGLALLTMMVASNALSDDNAKQLFLARCSSCHDVESTTRTRRTESQWGQLVSTMVARGAKLSEAESAQVVEYLTENYGVKASSRAPSFEN